MAAAALHIYHLWCRWLLIKGDSLLLAAFVQIWLTFSQFLDWMLTTYLCMDVCVGLIEWSNRWDSIVDVVVGLNKWLMNEVGCTLIECWWSWIRCVCKVRDSCSIVAWMMVNGWIEILLDSMPKYGVKDDWEDYSTCRIWMRFQFRSMLANEGKVLLNVKSMIEAMSGLLGACLKWRSMSWDYCMHCFDSTAELL